VPGIPRDLTMLVTPGTIFIAHPVPTLTKPNGCARNMKKLPLLSLLCIFALLTLVPAAGADSPTVMVADFSLSPAVLQPGDIGTITAIIRSTASSASRTESSGIQPSGAAERLTSQDISVNIESVQLVSSDVEVISGNFKRVGALGPGQSIPITFVIRAPAQDGIYFPEIWIDVSGGQSVRQPVPVNVNTQVALLKKPALSALKTVPEGVSPGEEVAAQVVLLNNGESRASQVTINVNCSSPTITQKTPSTFHAGTLEKAESTTVDMVFLTDKNTPVGINRVCLDITYANPDGTITTQNEVIGINVRGKAKIGIASLKTEPVRIRQGDAVSIVIRLENTGTDNANSVKATLDLPFAGTHDAYVGKIEPDNDAPAVFSLQAGTAGTYTYNLTVEYEDDYGVQTTQETLRMTVFENGFPPLLIVVVILLVFGAVAASVYFLQKKKGSGDA